jgi:DNA-binding CsgD family transcriptional regulator
MPAQPLSLVGRDTELAILEGALAAARDGCGGSVFLVGDAGIGKSRLAAEAVSRAIAAGMVVLRGRSSTLGPMVPFRPLTEALLSLVRRGELPDGDELGPYRPVLGQLVPDWATGDGGPATVSLVVLGEAVLRLTSVIGRSRGCLLVLEDLHDVDLETLAVVEYLADNLDQQATVLLGTIRETATPALDVVRSAARRQIGTVLELDRLPRQDMVAMVGSCLGIAPEDVPAPVADALWRNSVGNPLMIEELLRGMTGSGQLVHETDGWRMVPGVRTEVPTTLMRSITMRIDGLDEHGHAVLCAAVVLGHRFPLSLVRRITGLDDRTLLERLHTLVTKQLLAADEHGPDWYGFPHPLVAQALLAQLTPPDRVEYSRRAAEAITALHPDLAGDWCQLVAALRLAAGDVVEAAVLFADAGGRAMADGALGSAITLLDKAEGLLAEQGDWARRAEVLQTLLYALAEANEVDRAFELAEALAAYEFGLDNGRRVALRVRLAWLAGIAGRWDVGQTQVAEARALLGHHGSAIDAAPIDAVAAHLALDMPGRDRLTESETLARSALAAVEAEPSSPAAPVISCQAWHAIAVIARERDLEESNGWFERMRLTAQVHRLPIWRTYGQTGPTTNAWLAEGDRDALSDAVEDALRVGAINAANSLKAVRTLDAVLCGEHKLAAAMLDEQLTVARRMHVIVVERYLLMVSAVLAAHRCDRPAMDRALAEFHERGGGRSREAPLTVGLARAFCALLEADLDRVRAELEVVLASQRTNPTTFYLAGRHGLHVLLLVLDPAGDRAEFDRLTSTAMASMRWNRQFVRLGQAVLAGRAGRAEDAATAMSQAQQAAGRYPLARHAGLWLVAEAAHRDGWGDPATWLRQAEQHFHDVPAPAVANACRAALRRVGAPVPQRRTDSGRVPGLLRTRGVTSREYDVYELLLLRLRNKEIAQRLHISPRTVENHVASLLAKTDHESRDALINHGSAALIENVSGGHTGGATTT